jgi:lysophospholipase-2
MSTYLALRDDFPDAMSPNAKDLPVFLAHGTADQVLQYQYGVASHEHMTEKLGMTAVSFQTYQGMGHSACQEELQQLANFIANVLERTVV